MNNYITLRLEHNETILYINGEQFEQCKYLLLNIPEDEIQECDSYNLIDEAAEFLDTSLDIGVNMGVIIGLILIGSIALKTIKKIKLEI